VKDYWQHLTSTALLGTERQTLPTVDPVLAPLLSPSEDKEKTLLDAAALTSLYIRSGQATTRSSHPPIPVSPETVLPHDPGEALYIFNAVAEHGELWREWLELSIKYNVPPLPRTLHRLLELGKAATLLRPKIAQVMGAKGHWLAQFISEASWLLPEDLPVSVWEEGSLPERLAYISKIRLENPEQARGMLETIWKQENAEARTGLLETLKTNLSLNDEAFLETCLDDKSKRVRELASEFLSSLVDSALTQRMIKRAQPFLTYTPATMLGLKKASLEVRLPESFDKDWSRDGIEQKNVPYGMGEKAWWLKQLLERVPPSIWGQPTILSGVSKEWESLLREAFRQATLRFADNTWITYFLPDQAMVRLLPLQERQCYLIGYLANLQGPLSSRDILWNLLIDLPKPWGEALNESLLKRAQLSLLNWSRIQNGSSWQEQMSLLAFAEHLPVTFAEQIPAAVAEKYKSSDHPLHQAFLKMVSLLELRTRMHKYFGEG
jgi:hypothetical protein